MKVPTEFFIVVTTDDPVIAWNMSLGRITSAGVARALIEPDTYAQLKDQWFPLTPNPEFQTAVSWQLSRVIADYRAEHHAERVRCMNFPHLPSRLACLYAWGSLEDVRRARKIGSRFRGVVKRCTLAGPPLRIARCNSAIVPFARRVEERNMLQDEAHTNAIWRSYWSGSGESLTVERENILEPSGPPEVMGMSTEPLWEWLIDGSLEIHEDVDLGAA